MEYQEIVTAYKKNDLDISDLKKKLEISKPLMGRPKYRAIDIIDNNLTLNNEIANLLTMPENAEKAVKFLDNLDLLLNSYFANLIGSVKSCKAWNIIGMIPKGWSQPEFETLTKTNKFKVLYDINKKYYKFLEYQRIADVRDFIEYDSVLNDEKIKRLQFLILMFENFKNQTIKDEFFCFDREFLMAVINFKRSKKLRMEEYMQEKKVSIQEDYKKYSRYFSTKDFRDIIENLKLTSKTLKISLTTVINIFCDLSESETEKTHLSDDFKQLKKLEKKYILMDKLKVKEKVEVKETEKEKEKVQIKVTPAKKEAPKSISVNKKVNKVKQQVNPMILSWFEQEDITLTRRISLKKLYAFFDTIKNIEKETGARVSLFLVTNANKETTLKRMIELSKKSSAQGLPNLFEAAFGGYSTFKINKDTKITDIAKMSEINRNKIINLLEKTDLQYVSKDLIRKDETDFVRYQLFERKNKNITKEYLDSVINKILKDEKVKKQPIKFLPYLEKNTAGIDVMLESQLIGIEKIPEYYKTKYAITTDNIITADVSNIDEFIGEIVSENVAN